MTKPTTCCGRSGEACVCASQAKCSCGKQSALNCNCKKAKTENTVTGARCSCRKSTYSSECSRFEPSSRALCLLYNMPVLTYVRSLGARPAGECTCDRAATENSKVAGSTCSCGARPASESPLVQPRFKQNNPNSLQMPAAARKLLTAASSPPKPTSPPRQLLLRIPLHYTLRSTLHS